MIRLVFRGGVPELLARASLPMPSSLYRMCLSGSRKQQITYQPCFPFKKTNILRQFLARQQKQQTPQKYYFAVQCQFWRYAAELFIFYDSCCFSYYAIADVVLKLLLFCFTSVYIHIYATIMLTKKCAFL